MIAVAFGGPHRPRRLRGTDQLWLPLPCRFVKTSHGVGSIVLAAPIVRQLTDQTRFNVILGRTSD